MTLLLLFNQPAGGSATGTAFRSFVEAGMIQPDWQIDDYLVATVQTHDSTGQAAAADAVPSYVIRNAETGATVDSGDFAAVAGVDGFYVLRRQLTAAAGFTAMTTYTLRVEALMATVPAADSGVFRVGAWTEIRGTKNTLDALLTALRGAGWTDETLASLDVLLDAIKAKTDSLPSDPADQSAVEGAITAAAAGLATSAAVAALNDITVADIIAGISEGDLDLQEMLRIILAGVAGKASGGGTTEVRFRNQADTKDRIVMTLADDDTGDRLAVTVDGS